MANNSTNNIRRSYETYLKFSNNPVSIQTYLLLCYSFNKFIVNKVLEGNEVVLPARLGSLVIRGIKQQIKFSENGEIKGLAPDWVKTKQLWDADPEAKKSKKLLYHMNHSTNGYRYSWFWSKKNAAVQYKGLYSLRMSRENKRRTSKCILSGKEYIVKL